MSEVAQLSGATVLRGDQGAASYLDLERLREVRPSQLRAVRGPSSYVGMPNYIGILSIQECDGERHAEWHESYNELLRLLHLSLVEGARWLLTQPLRFEWRFPAGGVREHTPDVLYLDEHGRPVVMDITRHERWLEDDHLRAIAALTQRTCALMGWRYRLVTEVSEQCSRNLRFMWGMRSLRRIPVEEVPELSVLPDDRVIDLERRLGGGPLARRLILAGLLQHRLFIDWDEPLNSWSPLYRQPLDNQPDWELL